MLTWWDYDNTAGHFQQFAKGGNQPSQPRSQTTMDACISKNKPTFRLLLTSILTGSWLRGAGRLLSSVEGEKERGRSPLSSTMSTTANNRTHRFAERWALPRLSWMLICLPTWHSGNVTCRPLDYVRPLLNFDPYQDRSDQDTPTSIKKKELSSSATVLYCTVRADQFKSRCNDHCMVGPSLRSYTSWEVSWCTAESGCKLLRSRRLICKFPC